MKDTCPSNFDITAFSSYRNVAGQYTDSFIKKTGAVKVEDGRASVTVAVKESGMRDCSPNLINFHTGRKVEFIPVSDTAFEEFIGNVVESHCCMTSEKSAQDTSGFVLEDVSTSSVINILNSVFLEAVRSRASDIHIEPGTGEMQIRFRIDGVMKIVRRLRMDLFPGIVGRIKIMANLNIMENRLPQDGHIQVTVENKKLDMRLSTVPVQQGESVVLRLFNTQAVAPELGGLGFSQETLARLSLSAGYPNGLVLITGPTGSGKTTTLHALLCTMDRQRLKIITIEDPVENSIPGISQIQVHEEIGLGFDSLLRRVLRQDPDVIMVGEIRDRETAELALRAALTGHLIFATLHTNDSMSAVTRLENMGLEPYLIASVLRMCTAQRLVRRVCPFCAKKITVPSALRKLGNDLSLPDVEYIREECGCEQCSYTGFSGRTVISELFEVDELSAAKISGRQELVKDRRNSLLYDGVRKVFSGDTTVSELQREGIL
jgi:Type II secretory pathway, ATPase PulE/Tfp pilus assembly pathway, ATPase PilB